MDMQKRMPKVHSTTVPPASNPDPGGNAATIAPLITMIAVLAIILIFCFCGAPAVRQFCKRKVCCCCPFPKPAETPGQRNREDDDFFVLTSIVAAKNGEVPQSTTAQQRQQ